MKKLGLKILLFIGLNIFLLVILLFFLNQHVEDREFENWSTESNLLHMPYNEHFDILILGTSHARSFSRAKNHLRMEKILDKKILNLSQGEGKGGILNQYAYLRYFNYVGNSADTIIYFLDPFVFYNRYFDNKDKLFNMEPVRLPFLYIMIDLRFDLGVIYTYLYSKFTENWLDHKPFNWNSIDKKVETVNAVSVFKRYNVVYPDKIDTITFNKKIKLIEKIASRIRSKYKTPVIFMVPPSLILWPGHAKLIEILKELKQEKGIPYYDFSEIMREKKYYKDHDHLNTDGLIYFTEHYLDTIVNKPAKTLPHNHQ